MEILEITDKTNWEDFVQKNKPDSFLHSWNWGEFNKSREGEIWRFGVKEEQEILAVFLVIFIKAKRGKFLFIPHGPIISKEEKVESILEKITEKLKEIGKEKKADFIRISPLLEKNEGNLNFFRKIGFKDSPIHMMHPETTWILNIEEDEEKIMKMMKKSHRNLIRRAKKEEVEILQGTSEEFLKEFYKIHMETVARHKFTPFSYDYIKKELDFFSKDNQISIFLAKYKGEIISSAIIVFYAEEAFYHHGASSSKYAKIPSSYLTLFEAISEAKKRNLKKFNFYGIVEDKPKHPWYGLSKFKKGFGGYKSEILHCQDLPLTYKYHFTCLVEKIRKIKRGY